MCHIPFGGLMSTFQDAYRHLLEPVPVEPDPPATRSAVFRDLVFKLLTTTPTFRERFSDVALYAGYLSPDGDLSSSTIDMVAQSHGGGGAAIQCRLSPTREELQSFLREAAHEPRYTECLLFTAMDREAIGPPPRPVQILDPRGLDALDPPIDWDSLVDDEELRRRSGLAGVRPPRAVVVEARQHIRDAIDGIRDVIREMETQLDSQEVAEAEVAEHQLRLDLLREVALSALEDLNKRLDVLRPTEARPWAEHLKRLAPLVEKPLVAQLVVRAGETLSRFLAS
jgi:hypothetical protein